MGSIFVKVCGGRKLGVNADKSGAMVVEREGYSDCSIKIDVNAFKDRLNCIFRCGNR